MNLLQKESMEPRLDGIEKEVVLLRSFVDLPFKTFNSDVVLDRTHLHLRFALEDIFHIGSHILSRTPGGRFTEYREIARNLGEVGVIDKTFAQTTLVKMTGYRNRLTHLYAQITPEELYKILKNHLADIETFIQAIKKFMRNPKKYGFRIE
jgi:uncharacterized protein YutE (UPF0331/DUF86 family)